MSELVHEFVRNSARRTPGAPALVHGAQRLDYAALADAQEAAMQRLLAAGIKRGERVAIYLEKRVEAVAAMFGAAAAGAVFVPVNPLLKPEQVAYILRDCQVKILLTSPERQRLLASVLPSCPDLATVLLTGDDIAPASPRAPHRVIDTDMAAILYTSGSTGSPKGVVLSHRNLVAGARSVASYLDMTDQDRVLAVLPLSFDYGLSQLTTAFYAGACAVLINHLFPRDIVKAVVDEAITGLAAVPPLWMQLAALDWRAATSLRYLTNSGGAMPQATSAALQTALPQAQLFLMYGLTEAFRSTYLPPSELARRPDSIGRAIPNAEILVVRPDGSLCADDEEGELVHRGALVAMGYWNDPARTAERFRPAPGTDPALPLVEMAVWSGDSVRRDAEGFLYFVGRSDDMIKVSGYRISPTEIEEVIHGAGLAAEVAAFGVAHPQLGHAIVLLAFSTLSAEELRKQCQRRLPAYMVPAHVAIVDSPLARNPNGKLDRQLLKLPYLTLFEGETP
jgi:acyl-CoA ligase (AMP-forming) (exosortase A-associated)